MPGKKAFTLIELLVVIIIMGLLSALLLPACARAKQRAQSAYCMNNLRQMWQGILLYADDNQNLVPFTIEPLAGEDPTDKTAFPSSFFNVMCPRYLTPRIFVCPSAKQGLGGNTSATWKQTYQFFGANTLGTPWPWDSSKADYDDYGYDSYGNYNFGVYTPLDGRPLQFLHTVYLRPILRDLPAANDANLFPHPFRITQPGTPQAAKTAGYALHASRGGDISTEQETKYWSSFKP